MIATVVGFTPSGAAHIKPDGSYSIFRAHQNVVNACPVSLDFGDRVNVRLAKDRVGDMVVVKIEPAH